MMSVRVCVLLFVSALTMAQSNPVPLINQPLATGLPNGVSRPDAATQGKMVENYGKLPLSFEANQGQTDGRVKFLSRGSGYSLFLTNDGAVFSLRGSNAKTTDKSPHSLATRQPEDLATTTSVLRMKLVKANPSAKIAGEDELPGKSNYFIGNDPKKWRSDVPTFGKVKYEGVYPGIDLVYYGNQRQLEYDFVVAPGADPRRVQFDVRGAKRITQDEQGDLVLQTGAGEVRWVKPVVYQEKDGTRQEIAAHYVVNDKNRVGFAVAGYDLRRQLFIDPLIYSTYLGGNDLDAGYGITVDSSGNAYVAGATASTNFPTKNPLQPSYDGGQYDCFVAKLNPTGSALVYSTFFGGSGDDSALFIAVHSSGSAYITGSTTSTNFPTKNPLQASFGGGTDAFVAKLNSTGSALVYSTYIGGSGREYGTGIAVDSSGNAYVAGGTTSTNFPTKNPLQPGYGGGQYDAFVAKLNPTGSAFVYSTFLGGSDLDFGYGVAVDSSGDAYVAGYTESTDFPTENPVQASNAGGLDAFVAEINPTGSALVYSTYLGGSGDENCYGLALDNSGNAYIMGSTASTDFPTVNALQPKYGGGATDAFVAQLNSTGSAVVYSTYLGGSGADVAFGITVDSSANAYVSGYTTSTNFPTKNPLQPGYGGGQYDAFVAKLNPTGSGLLYSTYLGGNNDDFGQGIAVGSSGNAYVTGYTGSTNFPTVNPLQPKYGGGQYDAFVAKIAKPSAFIKLAPLNLHFGDQTVDITSSPQNSTLTNRGELSLTIVSINLVGPNSGDFTESNNCPASLAAGKSCTIAVAFKPSGTGTRTATVSLTDNAPGSPQSVPLSGVGVLPTVTLSPTSLTFPNQVLFTASTAKVVTLKNSGLGVATIKSIAVTGPFIQTRSCGTTVKSGGSCTISVTFEPKTMGALTGSLTVTDNASNSPQKVTLEGTGTYIRLAPTSINFGNQPEGSKSLAKQITLTNEGAAAVTITSIAIAGTDSGDFAQTHTCGTSVASGASCSINVTFKPSATGTRTAQVAITDNGGGSPQKVSLTGTGTP
jgi:hypothetical protein